MQSAALLLSLLAVLGSSPPADPGAETPARFPSLQTTLVDPRADDGPLTFPCAVLDGERRCEESLLEAWCVKQGFAGYVAYQGAAARRDLSADGQPEQAFVRSITCRRPPIVGD